MSGFLDKQTFRYSYVELSSSMAGSLHVDVILHIIRIARIVMPVNGDERAVMTEKEVRKSAAVLRSSE